MTVVFITVLSVGIRPLSEYGDVRVRERGDFRDGKLTPDAFYDSGGSSNTGSTDIKKKGRHFFPSLSVVITVHILFIV